MLTSIDRIGLSERQTGQLDRLIAQPNGLLIFAGPAGSGKTITLYSCLKKLASPQKKLLTIEDPVLTMLPYATQIQVDKRSDITYVSAFGAIMRHDPDIIYLDEIPDQDTAKVAAQCVLTGHLLLTSLLANDAAGAFTVLVDTGIEPHIVAATVIGIVAQRLVRKLCPDCKAPAAEIEPSLLATVYDLAARGGYDIPEDAVFYSSAGCEQCGNRGFKGRTGIYEIVEATDAILAAVTQRTPPEGVRQLIRAAGTPSIFADGIRKAVKGLTTIEEVMRVTYPLT